MGIFRGNVTTDPEFQTLLDTVGRPHKGQVWTVEEIKNIIHEDPKKGRGRRIVDRWRSRILRDYNLVIASIPGEGFHCLEDGRIHTKIVSKIQGIGRATERTRRFIAAVDDRNLSEEDKVVFHHSESIIARLGNYISSEKRRLLTEASINEKNEE